MASKQNLEYIYETINSPEQFQRTVEDLTNQLMEKSRRRWLTHTRIVKLI